MEIDLCPTACHACVFQKLRPPQWWLGLEHTHRAPHPLSEQPTATRVSVIVARPCFLLSLGFSFSFQMNVFITHVSISASDFETVPSCSYGAACCGDTR